MKMHKINDYCLKCAFLRSEIIIMLTNRAGTVRVSLMQYTYSTFKCYGCSISNHHHKEKDGNIPVLKHILFAIQSPNTNR